VALDANLQRIERVDATSAFANANSVSAIAIAGEKPADCLFGKLDNVFRDGVPCAVCQSNLCKTKKETKKLL